MLDTALPTEPAQNRTTSSPGPIPRPRNRAILKGIALAALVMLVAECLRIFVGSNFHAVVPGKCYRSAQPTPAFLDTIQRTHGIRSIVNLRDENEEESWYQQEKQAARRLGLELINAGLWSKEQPPPEDFHRFVQAMKNAPEPILIHCANGNDRTSLAAAVYLLMRTTTPIPEARGQLSLRYGHIAWSKASCLHRILDSYETWLGQNGKDHHADHFYYWGMHVYRQEVIQ
jgi:protein tyrosine phosphatase (PTP) superfamily phosphohydrolase (DUF442 family)